MSCAGGFAGSTSSRKTTMDVRRESPLTFEAIEPVLVQSRVFRFVQRLSDRFASAADGAATVALAARAARLGADEPAGFVANAAWLTAVAAITHVAMLLFAERYHFPSRAALVLPGIIAVMALAIVWLRHDISRALADRRRR
jgi:hypothetical protein